MLIVIGIFPAITLSSKNLEPLPQYVRESGKVRPSTVIPAREEVLWYPAATSGGKRTHAKSVRRALYSSYESQVGCSKDNNRGRGELWIGTGLKYYVIQG